MQKAVFGAGCFWGVEEIFRRIEGVHSTRCGYMGGSLKSPDYQAVCTGTTGHAEVVEVEYDPFRVSYDTLLKVFWEIHDPTALNHQGPDIGTQYRSVIFYSGDQKAKALASKKELMCSGKFTQPIVTEILPATDFYEAEARHQNFISKRSR